MFIKQKRDGNIKGITVAGRNKQRDYISKEDATVTSAIKDSNFIGEGHSFCSVGRLPFE
jgi:hypothetical protein